MSARDHATTCAYLVKHQACTCGACRPAELTADGPASPKPPPQGVRASAKRVG